MEQRTETSAGGLGPATKRDFELGTFAGAIIGLLALPILNTAKPEIFAKIWWAVPVVFVIISPLGLLIASFLSKYLSLIWQIAKFILIGVMNTLVDIGLLAATISIARNTAGIEPTLAVLGPITVYSFYKGLSFLAANVNSFIWNKHWTFSGTPEKKDSTQFMQFLAVSVIGFFINIFFASYVFTSIHPLAGMNASQWGLIGGACGSVMGLVWNFVGYKLFVFKK